MKKGDFVKINYVGRLETGEIFDLTKEETAKKEGIYNSKIRYGPMPVIVGANFLIKGLDNALLKMNVGDKKDIEVKPEDGFGQRDANMVRTVPRKVFRDHNLEPKQGMIVDFGGMKGRIQSVDAGRIRVDFNNPLAGHALKYIVEVEEKIDEPENKIKSVFEFFGIRDVNPILKDDLVTINVKLPGQIKEKISSLVIEYVDGVEKVDFVETYEKKNIPQQAHERRTR